MKKNCYLSDPCGASSLPFWKTETVTVSGKVNNPTNPLSLFERCGFFGKMIWHVMRNA